MNVLLSPPALLLGFAVVWGACLGCCVAAFVIVLRARAS